MKRDKELRTKKAELVDLEVKIHELTKNIAAMSRVPRSDYEHRSEAKLENWKKDLGKLTEKQAGLFQEIAQLTNDPGRLEDITGASTSLTAKKTEIYKSMDGLKTKYNALRYGMGEKVATGADPMALSKELHDLKESIEEHQRAIEAVGAGLAYLTKLHQAPPFRAPLPIDGEREPAGPPSYLAP
jgi:chromosome segregation ATPase